MLPDLNSLPPDLNSLPVQVGGSGDAEADEVVEAVVPPSPPGGSQNEDLQNLQRHRVHAELPSDLNTEQPEEQEALRQLSAFYSTDSGK